MRRDLWAILGLTALRRPLGCLTAVFGFAVFILLLALLGRLVPHRRPSSQPAPTPETLPATCPWEITEIYQSTYRGQPYIHARCGRGGPAFRVRGGPGWEQRLQREMQRRWEEYRAGRTRRQELLRRWRTHRRPGATAPAQR